MKEYKKSLPVYHTAAWRQCCAIVKSRQGGMCAECMRNFDMGYGIKPRRAQMVHHIIPYRERPDLAYDLDNLEALCFECHEQRHPERRQTHADESEAPRMRVVKV